MSWYNRVSALQKSALWQRQQLNRMGGGAYFVKPEPPIPFAKDDPVSGWTPKSLRTGLLAQKIGMMQQVSEWGHLLPITVLQIHDCQVLQVRTPEKDGYNALQIGAGLRKVKRTPRSLKGQFAKVGVSPKRKIIEFRISPDAVVKEGTTLYANHFVPGQLVDVTGKTRGKGFQGAMKRWGFSGLPASHGVSLTHRSIGATGARQDPGKVWKGKKMAGQMGGLNRVARRLPIFSIDAAENCLHVVGAVPGGNGGWVEVKDAYGYKFSQVPPFPTFVPSKEAIIENQISVETPIATPEASSTTQSQTPATTSKSPKKGKKVTPSIPTETQVKSPPLKKTIFRAAWPKPSYELDTEEDEFSELLQDRFPLKLSPEMEQKFEEIRIKYRRQLIRGDVGTIIRAEFADWLPTKQEAIEEKMKEDQVLEIFKKKKQDISLRQKPVNAPREKILLAKQEAKKDKNEEEKRERQELKNKNKNKK